MPSSDRTFKRGDVVVLPYPYTNRLAEKRRPALVVSSDEFNARSGLLWVAMITSAGQNSLPDDIALENEETGLGTASVARLSKLATIEADRVIRVAGRIDGKTRKDIRKALSEIVG